MVVRNTSVLGREGVLQMKGDLFLENTRVLTSLSRDSKDMRLPLAHGRIGSVKTFPSLRCVYSIRSISLPISPEGCKTPQILCTCV